MGTASNDVTVNVTLEDDAWKDSFDKLLESQGVLRELNVVKNVRASFNIDSSLENSRNDSLCVVSAPKGLSVPSTTLKNQDKRTANKRHGSVSTPVVNKLALNPFKCSLSPIGAMTFIHFKGKSKLDEGQNFHATPINPDIIVADYEEKAETSFTTVTDNQILPNHRSSLVGHESSKQKKNRMKRRHVCFEPSNSNIHEETTQMLLHVFEPESSHHSKECPTNLTLQSGKWRKSLSLWRRTQRLTEQRKTASIHNALPDNSVEFVGVTKFVGNRKSAFIKSERKYTRSTSITSICNEGEWESNVLKRCGQRKPLPFEELYSAENMQKCRKIGEGAFGEVFINSSEFEDSVLKIIPIEGQYKINGEEQKTFEQILPEIIISMELYALRNATNQIHATDGFVGVKKVACIKGKYPEHLIKLWAEYDDSKGSENDHPEVFLDSQIYIVLELAYGGTDLEAFVFSNAEQSYYVLQQVVLTLAVGEEAFQFEHRDLHWGNILISKTSDKHFRCKLHNKELILPTKGVKATIIDYTLSRMIFADICHYNDLSRDEELFTATGDYQFDIYRMMREVLKNNWEIYEPKTNIFWISYIIDKMLNGVSYKSVRSKIHKTYINKLNHLKDIVLNLRSAAEFAEHLQKVA